MVTAPARDGKVNILLVASSLWIGGAESVMQHLAMTLDRRRFNVSVCYLKERGQVGDELARAGIDIVGVNDSDRVDYLTFLKLRRIIAAKHIDVVHTHTTHGLVDAAMCKLLRPRLKLVHTFHFGNYPHTEPRILWMERLFSRAADRLLAVGDGQRAQLRAVYRFRDRMIQTLRNGVMLPSGTGDPTFRASIGAERCVLVGTIATLIRQKGLPDLMRVARKVRDAGRNVKFVIAGEGHLRGELEALRRELDLEGTVVLTGWVTNAAEVALPAFDVFFQPSLWEAMSMVTLEAMGAGKPVVATRVGEAPFVITDNVDGMLVDAGDVDGMAAALIRLIDDPALRARMGQAARKRVEDHFTVAHMTRAYEQVYLETQL
jgi:glycosyltransferase involved in cell wall biosynthesis